LAPGPVTGCEGGEINPEEFARRRRAARATEAARRASRCLTEPMRSGLGTDGRGSRFPRRFASLSPTDVTRLAAAGATLDFDAVAQLAAALGTTLHDLVPPSESPDPTAHLRARGEALLRQLAGKADRDLLTALIPLLARLTAAPSKGR
jgi:hypothetical protein